MSTYSDSFTLRVEQATFLPDEAGVRAFIEQLNQALESDPALAARFEDDARGVLSDRGASLDVQREVLGASGLSGAEDICVLTCWVTEFSCGVTIVIVSA